MSERFELSACRPEAAAALREALPALSTLRGLVRAATALCVHTDPTARGDDVMARLLALADQVRRRVKSGRRDALVAHAHDVLFGDQGFRGNRDEFYDPRNSHLPWVLAQRRGIPITLTLVYKAVLETLGVPVAGIGAPGHFLARVEVEGKPALIDPFHGGIELSLEEVRRRSEETLGRPLPTEAALLPAVDHAAWLRRMLRNLQEAHRRQGVERDRHAMQELELVLDRHLRSDPPRQPPSSGSAGR
jgi:regulator of sirC expression with transglutaminase-like and TPR domain